MLLISIIHIFQGEFQKKSNLDISQMLEDEIDWLCNFTRSKHPDLEETDNVLLAGHLKLIKTLFTCEGVDKEESGIKFNLIIYFLSPKLYDKISIKYSQSIVFVNTSS